MSGLFTSIRFVMALLTVLAIAAKPFIPPKTLLIHPRDDIYTGTFGPVIAGVPTTVALNEQETWWRCDYPERYNDLSCGLSVYWNLPGENQTPKTFIDASQYDGFVVEVDYEGRADYLRMFLSIANPHHQTIQPGLTEKQQTAFISTETLRDGPTFVSLKDFSVEQWWIISQNPPRSVATPEFEHVVGMGFDSIDAGIHRVKLIRLELLGERISQKAYLLLILFFWVVYLFLESLLRYYRLKQSARQQREQLEGLAGGTEQLAKENMELQSRSITDSLTAIHNRHGFNQRLKTLYGHRFLPAGTGVLIMDIDHFKAFNDRWGHQAGDTVLREFADLIGSEIRGRDIFARWGGEEFMLLVDGTSAAALDGLAEKLRRRVETHQFSVEAQVTMSVGVARTESIEAFDELFKRADQALYEAKKFRNCVRSAFSKLSAGPSL